MSTPLSGAVGRYLAQDRSRFHMPGHKGKALPFLGDAARWDITEVEGCDSLYEASGAIARTEEAYRALYGAAGSFLSAGGGTHCIQAMLALAAPPGARVLAARGAHVSAVNAMALLDLHPVWLYPAASPGGLAGPVSPSAVEEALRREAGIAAVYVTSPTYYGVISDIPGISAVCRRYGVPLLVDNAHGAHLRFLSPSLHPVALGADLCCDSLHKTLPVLTGGAVLHIADSRFLPDARRKLALFGSTSPSYLVLLSADAALPCLRDGFGKELEGVVRRMEQLSALALQKGFGSPGGPRDPARLTLDFGAAGYTAAEFGAHLRGYKIEPEYIGARHCVLMAGPCNERRDFARLEAALEGAVPRTPLPDMDAGFSPPEAVFSLRQAALAPCEALPPERSAGRIAGAAVCPCPPGIPVVVPGERIGEDCARLLKKVGFRTINVVK